MAKRTRCIPYSVAWRQIDDAGPLSGLPERACLKTVVRLCQKFGMKADLYDRCGYRRGWVHEDGNYKLK